MLNNSLLRPPAYEKGIKDNTGNRYPASNSIDIYPNPNSGHFYLKSAEKIRRIEINDVSGRNVFSRNCNSKLEEIELNEQKGIYIVKVILNKNTFINEVIIR